MAASMLTLIAGSLLLAQNLAPNPSFEQMTNDRPTGWRTQTWGGTARFSVSADAHSGKSAVLVESTDGADAGWTANLPVQPFSTYKLTAWIKTENVQTVREGQGALINLHNRSERTASVSGTKDWQQVSLELETGADDRIQVNCILGYFGTARGKAWFDDLSLELLSTRKPEPSVVIDGGKRYEPISKYIYSQFIEHLGRCIYGGIWAEMLEDRKFFYTVGNRQSPWKASAGGSVKMSTKYPFVGKQTPVVSGGVEQGGLWLQKGRDYTGYVWLNGAGQDVTVDLGGQSVKLKASPGWKKNGFKIKGLADTQTGVLAVKGSGDFSVGTVSLMPADNIDGMRRDTIALLKELDAPLYRWPGGNFVSGYDWRDGIGDRDRRPPRRNPAWQGIEHNDFGTHEFLRFCEVLKTEPLIVVNTGYGDAHSAAAWVQYVNGQASTEEGVRRRKNGHRDAWDVKWWGIGNEMFGNWQLGYMSLPQYQTKHNIVWDRMTAVDPTIKTIAVGEIGGDWSKGMLTNCQNAMDLISEHFYCQERSSVMAHVAQVPNAIKAKVRAHRQYRETIPGLKEKGIKIAMDEWNYWYGPHVFGELGTRYFVKDGLGIAAGLQEFYRSTDIVGMAQYAQTVNVIGAIKTTPIAAEMETTGLVLKMYRQHYGTIPVDVTGSPDPLYVSAALTEDGKFLTIGIVNPLPNDVTFPTAFTNLRLGSTAEGWIIANPDPMVYNNPGDPPKVKIEHLRALTIGSSQTVPGYSATVLRVPVQ